MMVERLKLKHDLLVQALATLKKALDHTKKKTDPEDLDAAYDSEIQRFEYCFDEFWKFLKMYLSLEHDIQLASPKPVFHQCFALGIIADRELARLLEAADERRALATAYRPSCSQSICRNIAMYHGIMLEVGSSCRNHCG